MNDERYKQIAKAQVLIAEARSILEEVLSDEQEAFERGETTAETISKLKEAISNCENIGEGLVL